MPLEQVQTLRALNLSPEELTAQIAEYQRLSGQQKDKTAPISYKDAVGDQGADQAEQKWELMDVHNAGAEAQTAKIAVASMLNWRYVVNVSGCGNCGYTALALRLITALAAAPVGVRQAFAEHAQQVTSRACANEHIVPVRLPSGATVPFGCTVFLDWLNSEAQQPRGSGLPSRQLLRSFSSDTRSKEAVVLWVRAIAGHHMMTNHDVDFVTKSEMEWAHDGRDTTVVEGCLWEMVLRFVLPMAVKAEDGADWVDRFPKCSTLQAVANELHLWIDMGSWWWQKETHGSTVPICSANTSCWTAAKLQLVFLPYEGHFVAAWP